MQLCLRPFLSGLAEGIFKIGATSGLRSDVLDRSRIEQAHHQQDEQVLPKNTALCRRCSIRWQRKRSQQLRQSRTERSFDIGMVEIALMAGSLVIRHAQQVDAARNPGEIYRPDLDIDHDAGKISGMEIGDVLVYVIG
jgi:hypothetical protein